MKELDSREEYYWNKYPSNIREHHEHLLYQFRQDGLDVSNLDLTNLQLDLMIRDPDIKNAYLPFIAHLLKVSHPQYTGHIKQIINDNILGQNKDKWELIIPDADPETYRDIISVADIVYLPYLYGEHPHLCQFNPKYLDRQIVRIFGQADFDRLRFIIKNKIVGKNQLCKIVGKYYIDIIWLLAKGAVGHTLHTCTTDDLFEQLEDCDTDSDRKKLEIEIAKRSKTGKRVGFMKVSSQFDTYTKTVRLLNAFFESGKNGERSNFVKWSKSIKCLDLVRFMTKYYLYFILEPFFAGVKSILGATEYAVWYNKIYRKLVSSKPGKGEFKCYTCYGKVKIWMTRYLYNDNGYYKMCKLLEVEPERQISDFYTGKV